MQCAGPSHDGHGFRAYSQSANNKRKASEIGNPINVPAAKQPSHPMARAASMTGTLRVRSSASPVLTACWLLCLYNTLNPDS